MDENARRWREALLATLRPYPEDLPLLLSGGMDSLTLLAALLKLGRSPTCYVIRLAGGPTEDSDAAIRAARENDVPYRLVEIPDDPDECRKRTEYVIRSINSARKTAVQCCWTLYYALADARENGETAMIIGTGGIVEDNRRTAILAADYERYETVAASIERRRRSNLLGGDPTSATETMKRFALSEGIPLYEPYSGNPVAEVGLSIPFPEMNRPRQKGIALRAFPEFHGPLDAPRYWRRNLALQSGAGVREHHDQTYETDPRRIRGVYGRIQRGQGTLL